ncbi:MAG: DUF4831 family protein [Bacteroidales bacterium]|nr:DUF4831 family protein [Bacteroidales bacterium]
MKNLKLTVILLVILFGAGCALQTEMASKTRVVKVESGMNVNDYAMYYSLPRTVLDIEVVVDKKITKPGPFAAYAERFLGLSSVPTRESVDYSIVEVKVNTHPEKDPQQMYRIETDGNPFGSRVSLTADGLIRGINLPVNPEVYVSQEARQHLSERAFDFPQYTDLTLRKNTEPIPDTVFRLVRTDTSFLKIPVIRKEENQKSLLNQANEAADVLMKLREGRFKLLNGEYAYVENDGSRLPEGTSLDVIVKELAVMEEGYVSLFAGRTQTERETMTFTYAPNGQGLTETFTLFAFSRKKGVEAAETGGSDPVMLQLSRTDTNPMDQIKWADDGKSAKVQGLAFRIPEKIRVEVIKGKDNVFSCDILIAQYGRVDFVPARLLTDQSTAVEFYPAYGSIKNIFRR